MEAACESNLFLFLLAWTEDTDVNIIGNNGYPRIGYSVPPHGNVSQPSRGANQVICRADYKRLNRCRYDGLDSFVVLFHPIGPVELITDDKFFCADHFEQGYHRNIYPDNANHGIIIFSPFKGLNQQEKIVRDVVQPERPRFYPAASVSNAGGHQLLMVLRIGSIIVHLEFFRIL